MLRYPVNGVGAGVYLAVGAGREWVGGVHLLKYNMEEYKYCVDV